MNRFVTTIAAFAALTGCSEDFESTSDGIVGSTPTGETSHPEGEPDDQLEIDPKSDDPIPGDPGGDPEDGGNIPADSAEWLPAYLPAGAYWMQFGEVFVQPDGSELQPGRREVAHAPRIEDTVYLHGFAPIESNLEELRAIGTNSFKAEEGDCTETVSLDAIGFYEGPEQFSMHIIETFEVAGADCDALGMGPERMDAFDYIAQFSFMEPTEEADRDEDGHRDEGGEERGGPTDGGGDPGSPL